MSLEQNNITAWENNNFFYPASHYPIPDKPIYLDIGPGRGDLTFHMAKENPDVLVIALEIKRKRVDRIINRLQRFEIENAAIVQGDARQTLPTLFPKPRVQRIHVHFPDPWPKKKHTKHRLLNNDLIKAASNALLPGGELVLVTDVEGYAEWATEGVINSKQFETLETSEGWDKNIFPTFFADKWKSMGRNVYIKRYKKLVT